MGPKKEKEGQVVRTDLKFSKRKPVNDKRIHIPTIIIKDVYKDMYEEDWKIYKEGETTRFFSRHGYEKIASLSFDINVESTAVQKMLLKGISIKEKAYSFLGCSSAGLKERRCYMWQGTPEEVREILEQNGDFEKIKMVSKQMARIGLLFSEVTLTDVEILDSDVIDSKDIKRNGYVFSDGCGGIGKTVAERLFSTLSGAGDDGGYLPSVYQVRYQGCKGVLALDNSIPTKIRIRDSMIKFRTDKYPFIGVCKYSKPYTFGHLNKQFIMLLSGLGIRDDVFEEKQNEHFFLLKTMLRNPESAITVLQWQNQFDIAQIIVKAGSIGSLTKQQMSEVMKELNDIQKRLIGKVTKLNILIRQSRNIFGICDPSDTLDYGECFLRITDSGVQRTVRGNVVVCKTPCYLLGDVRVLKAVDKTDKPGLSQLHHLVDCIVFPTRGPRPHPHEIAGSDLDGDEYFVTWDNDLIPANTRPPYDYPAYEPPCQGHVSTEMKIAYFSKQDETKKMITRITKHFDTFAEMKGVGCTECERLGQLFSRVIDAGKSGEMIPSIPASLKTQYVPEGCPNRSVWYRMKLKATEFEERFQPENAVALRKEVTEEFVAEITRAQYSNISEFKKFLLVLNHTRLLIADEEQVIKYILENYIDYINFALFSLDEQVQAIEVGVPRKIVINALNKSKILSKEELECFRCDTAASSWSQVVAEEQSSFEWRQLVTTVTNNDFVLLVMKFRQGVLQLQFLEKLRLGLEQTVSPGSISAIFYSYSKNKNMKYILGPTYYLDFTDNTHQSYRENNLQLYRERNKSRTFVMLKAVERQNRGCGEREGDKVVHLMSVDLQRFDRNIFRTEGHPPMNKELFANIEMYAQKKDGSVSYWDTIDVNDSLAVPETVTHEEEDRESIEAEFGQLFPATGFEDIPENGDEVSKSEGLRKVAESGNPHWFRAQLQSSREIEQTEETGFALLLLLSKVVERVVPRTLPESLQTVIIEIVTRVDGVLNEPSCALSVAGYLCRLHLVDIAKQVMQRDYKDTDLSVDSVIRVLEDWQSLWYIDTVAARTFLPKLMGQSHLKNVESIQMGDGDWVQESAVTAHSTPDKIAHSGGKDSPPERWKRSYIRHYGLLHALSMVSEADNQKRLFCEYKEVQSCIRHLKLDKTAYRESDTVLFYRSRALGYNTRIVEGQYVAISRHLDVKEHGFPRSVCGLGQVVKLQHAPFAISVKLSDVMPSIVSRSLSSDSMKYWRVDLIANIATYTRVVSAFKYFTDVVPHDNLFFYIIHPSGHNETSSLPGEDIGERFPKVRFYRTEDEIDCGDLNVTQTKAVSAALQHDITLVQGPPGTGKTKVACHAIKLINSMRNNSEERSRNPILVVAETNVAVDNLARRLRGHLLVVRIGSVDGVARDLHDVSLEGRMKLIANREAKKTEFRDEQGRIHRNTRLMDKVISAAEVVLTTCAGAGDVSLRNRQFEFVVVDEATQTMETTLLCSLAHGAKRIVMIGDPKQLGPVVPEMGVEPSEGGQQSSLELEDLSKTLFHRLCNVIPTCFLDTQHRMHPDIMEFPSQEFYDGKLKAAESLNERPQIMFPWPEVGGKTRPLCFIDVDGREDRVGTSFCNTEEINVVRKVVDVLLSVDEEKFRECRIGVGDVAILTLYQGQVKELQNRIEHDVAIRTVDGFQGQERDVIVVSTVRCNSGRVLGFSGDQRRINVLLTRAKRGLIIVGNGRTLGASETWQRWTNQAPRLEIADLRTGTTSHRREDQRRGGRGRNHRGSYQRGCNQRRRNRQGRNR